MSSGSDTAQIPLTFIKYNACSTELSKTIFSVCINLRFVLRKCGEILSYDAVRFMLSHCKHCRLSVTEWNERVNLSLDVEWLK